MMGPDKPQSWHVLVVDDDDALRRVLSRMVRAEGHTVTEAKNGISALRVLETTAIDLVVTDVVMPDMEGLELVRLIRKRTPRPKVIAISGGGRNATGDYLELARTFGADATLPKPFSAADLSGQIHRLMTGGSS